MNNVFFSINFLLGVIVLHYFFYIKFNNKFHIMDTIREKTKIIN